MTYKLIDNEPKLSSKASQIVEKLKSEINQVINADRVREPKLTPDETQEIAKLEGDIAKYKPWMDRLVTQLEEKQQQLNELNGNFMELIVCEEKTIEWIASEMAILPSMISILKETHRYVSYVANSSDLRIKAIKEIAREREVKNGS